MAARTTLAAMIIVPIQREGAHPGEGAVSRVLAVVTGCFLGWLVTYVFYFLIKLEAPALDSDSAKHPHQA